LAGSAVISSLSLKKFGSASSFSAIALLQVVPPSVDLAAKMPLNCSEVLSALKLAASAMAYAVPSGAKLTPGSEMR
jgi:hypothetical protein